MALQGYIKLHRKIKECWIWEEKPFDKRSAWIDMLLSASHQDNKFLFGGSLVSVKRGEFITSEVKLAARWGWSRKKVRSFLGVLETDKMLSKKGTTKYTAITIENYDLYQFEGTTKEQQKNSKGPAEGQLRNTINNEKNEKNVKEEIKDICGTSPPQKRFIPPTLEEVKAFCKERNNNVDPERFIDHYTANGWVRGKTKIKDWKACVRTWEKDNKNYQTPGKLDNRMDNRTNHEQRNYDDDFYSKLINNS